MTFNTKNPLGSTAVKDLYDNAQNLDVAVNSEDETWIDRLGRERLTFEGMSKASGDPALAIRAAQDAINAKQQAWESAGSAAIDADRAEDAASIAASANRTLFRPSYAALLAAMVGPPAQLDETPGRVTNDPDVDLNGDYIWRSGALVRSDIQAASASQVQRQFEQMMLGTDQVIHDDEGNLYGMAVVAGPKIVAGIGENVVTFGGGRMLVDEGGGFSLCDEVGRTALHIDKHGSLVYPAMPSGADYVRPQLGPVRYTEIMHIPLYGQSLSRGSIGDGPISVTQPYENITLAGGVNALPFMAVYNGTAFKPLVEQSLAESPSKNETPTSGICNGLVRRILEANPRNAASRFVMLGTSGGWGGQTVEQLSGTARLPYFLQQITDSFNVAQAQGKTYSIPAYVWIQGEAQLNSDPATADPFGARTVDSFVYDDRVRLLYERVVKHIVETTGQDFLPYMVTYQTGAHRTYSRSVMPIALSQWRCSKAHPFVVMAAPVYMMPTSADHVHLTTEGSWLLGEYHARAIFQSIYNSVGKWRPLEPISVDWQDAHIDIRFHVPYGEIVLDTALCAQAVNQGFDVWEGGGAPVLNIITAVAKTSKDSVRLSLARPAASGATLSYARGRDGDTGGPVSGPRGNLRDTNGTVDTATSPLGNTFALHNACVMFEFNKTTGF